MDPRLALVQADRLIDDDADPWVLSVAHHARAMVLRGQGALAPAADEFRLALRMAHRAGDRDREADVRASYGLHLGMAGRPRAGLEQLGAAIAAAGDPVILAKCHMRRGYVRYFFLVQAQEAMADLSIALTGLRAAEERVWEARTLNLMGLAQLAMGSTDTALRLIREAGDLFLREGEEVEAVVTLHNRGFIAYCHGDLPECLRLYDAATTRYASFEEDPVTLVIDRVEALLAARLGGDAVDLVTARVRKGSLQPSEEAELLFALASAQLAHDEPMSALETAARATRLFRRQRRSWWADQTELVLLLARDRSVHTGVRRRLADDAAALGERLDRSRSETAVAAWLLAGRAGVAAGHDSAGVWLDRAAHFRHRSTGLVRATGWRALAVKRDALDDRRGALAACRRGLDALDSHRSTLGSSELRALATRHGDELAALALRHAVHSGPRVLLEWSERWRATALTQPPVHPPEDAELAQSLAALRNTRRRLAEAQAEGSPTVGRLDDERTRLERAIRRRTHHLAGTSVSTTRFHAARLVDSLGDTTFVELVDIDGVLHALVARAGRVSHVVVGATSEAEQAVAFARFALRQAARGRPADLHDVGGRLETALLGDAVRRLGAGPVVVSPTSRLHATPWSLLPALDRLPVSVAPSAALWLRARAAAASGGGRVLIAGPGLESGGAEIDVLVSRHPEAVLLKLRDASVERALAAMDGAAVAHVAAHGHFRDDSPMFSSLDLDDGPLTVHDFERLDRAPHRIVLSACESGVVAPIGAGEMLGLVSAMLAMGSAGIVSSVAKVNDRATADLMLDVHAAMDDGEDLGHVLLRAREAARGDRVREATAAAFLAMGV